MPALTRMEYDVLLVTLAWLGGFLPLFLRAGIRARLRAALPRTLSWLAREPTGWTWVRCVGLALVLSPFVRMGLGVWQSIDALFVYTVLQPVPEAALWLSVQGRLVNYVALPLIGLLLVHDAVPGLGRRGIHDALAPHGLAPRRSWRHDAARGLALFFAIAIAFVGALALSRLVPSIVAGGDESQYWRNVTVPLILLLSASAGLGEELLFRGVLLRALGKVMRWWPAALLQALLFGLIHAGYGTWTHVLAPAVFGLGMAWVARVLGVVPAALLHMQVNVLFFTFDVAPAYVAANGLPGAALLASLVLSLAAASAWALWRTRADGVVLLWRSLLSGLREVPEPEPEPTPAA